ncbi:sodium:phosphate symporter [Neisseria arctica]|uniref:Sodium:phosphate symporter n=1 Tax=Neisseria arctica TaxID=1470200 RepID=A0A0J0YPI3_9NEIS|nr:Na/Pi symporter [Neisseria arctica]KLT72050.1 sodium:phosphate symporter [Neisseria arctica]UOO87339.1 Na/Pi symporter [Neisseria arctica]
MKFSSFRSVLIAVLLTSLAYSFWKSPAWLQLCYGLALFLFGMQCIEEGLRNAAGGTLERLMAQSTATPVRGMLFGMGATFILQSSTLVSLLTIAFLSTGLIGLAGGIAVLLGTNLGATSGIWLLALAGQSISLSPVAVPMLVFGILIGFFKGKMKAIGRVLVGIALIFIGIDAIKNGFQNVGDQVDFAMLAAGGALEVAVFSGIGLLLTIILQSTHATLILTLAALAGGQISLEQGFAIAVGSNVGSSISTALVGMLGSQRSGKRLALAHLLFNVVTAVLSLLLWLPLTGGVKMLAGWVGLNNLLQLALFHTLFNLLGLAVFWKLQNRLADMLMRWLPEKPEEVLIASEIESKARKPQKEPVSHALYLSKNMLKSSDTAVMAVHQELRHFGALCLEVICHVLFVSSKQLYEYAEQELPPPEPPLELDAEQLYRCHIKPVYSELLDFTSRADFEDAQQQHLMMQAQLAALHMVETVKDSKHLQKNMRHYLQQPDHSLYPHYLDLRKRLFDILVLFRQTAAQPLYSEDWYAGVARLEEYTVMLDTAFRSQVLLLLRDKQIDGWGSSSLMNDINYARRIGSGLLEILCVAEDKLLDETEEDTKILHV